MIVDGQKAFILACKAKFFSHNQTILLSKIVCRPMRFLALYLTILLAFYFISVLACILPNEIFSTLLDH